MLLAAADPHARTMPDDDLSASLDRARWSLSRDIDFDAIEADRLTPPWIRMVREVCLAELSALYATEMLLRDFYDDIDFCGFVSVWFYEEMKHHLVLRKYLERVGEVVAEAQLPRLRLAADDGPAIDTLTMHFCGEQRLAQRYAALSASAPEPVLRQIFTILAADELRHAAVYARYLRRAINGNPGALPAVLRLALWTMRTGPGNPGHRVAATDPSAVAGLDDPHYFHRMSGVYRMLAGEADGGVAVPEEAEEIGGLSRAAVAGL